MTRIKAIPYIGSKDRLNSIINKNLPDNIKTYCEPFSGGFSLAINLIKEGYLKEDCKVIYNDLDSELTNYFKCLKDNPMLLVDCLMDVMDDVVEEYNLGAINTKYIIQELKKRYRESNDVFKQSALYYWIKKSNKGGYKEYINVVENPNIVYLTGVLSLTSKIMQRVDILNKSYKDLIGLDNEDTFWYLDPPYVDYSNHTFYSQCSKDDVFNHVELRDYLKGIKGKFILSYNDCEEVRELYKDFNIYSINLVSKIGARGYTSELLISNYELNIKEGILVGLSENNIGEDGNSSKVKRGVKNEVWDLSFDELFSE